MTTKNVRKPKKNPESDQSQFGSIKVYDLVTGILPIFLPNAMMRGDTRKKNVLYFIVVIRTTHADPVIFYQTIY